VNRRTFMATAGAAGLSAAARLAPGAQDVEPKTDIWPFYAFDNGLRTVPTLDGKCKLLANLGYVGIEYHLNHARLPKMLEALDKHGLTLNAVYSVPWLEAPVDRKLPDTVKLLKGRSTRIEMAIRSKKHGRSDPKGDPRAIEKMTQISDWCADTGPVVSFYHHTGFWTERVDDGVRLAKKIDRENVGTNFNLVHWHWVKQTRPVEAALREALPHLFSVTINNGEKDGRKIAPLDEGNYGVLGFMAAVKKVGYTGQVGLQCYSVPGPSEKHLARSMKEWRRIGTELGVG
jgi:sugar phosphate isomerase/epimerase